MEDVPDWADRRCSCGAYIDENEIAYTIEWDDKENEDVCEGCYDAIASVEQ